MTKRKLILTLAAVLSTILLTTAGTLALFSDATATAESTLTAGTFCLTSERDDGDPVPGPMFYVTPLQGQTPWGAPGTLPTGVWAPGDANERTLIVQNPTNCSTLNGWLTGVKANLQSGDIALADKLWVTITTSKPATIGDQIVAQGWLSDFLSGTQPLLYADATKVPLYLSSIRYLHFNVAFDITADNSYQNNSLVVAFEVYGEQMNNNP